MSTIKDTLILWVISLFLMFGGHRWIEQALSITESISEILGVDEKFAEFVYKFSWWLGNIIRYTLLVIFLILACMGTIHLVWPKFLPGFLVG